MKRALFILSLCILGIIVYSNTFINSFHFDDLHTIVNNPKIHDLSNLKAIWDFWPTRFMHFFTLAINYHLGGTQVQGYHIGNLGIHLGSSLLVAWLAFLTLRSPWFAFFVAAIFLTHPLQTQAVNYITQRATLLAAFFYLASLSLYIKSRTAKIWQIPYLGSLLTGVLAMFSKESAVSLPLVIWLYGSLFLKKDGKFQWSSTIPYFLIAGLLPLTWQIMNPIDFSNLKSSTVSYAGGMPVWQYLLTEIKVLVTYLRLLAIPVHQIVDYNYPLAQSFLEIPVLLSGLLLCVVLAVGIKLNAKSKIIAFGIFWFFITLLPESSFWPNKDVIFEHRLYLPMAGFALFLVGGIYYSTKERFTRQGIVLLCLIVGTYSLLAHERNEVWSTEFTLWDDAVKKSPDLARPYLNRGVAYQMQNQPDLALADFNKALEIGPEDAIVYSNRGAIKKNKGDLQGALADLNRAAIVNPNYLGTYSNRAVVLEKLGRYEEAIKDFDRVLTNNPFYADGFSGRGQVYLSMNKPQEALADFNKAIVIYPRHAEAFNNRGIARSNMKDFEQALADFSASIAIDQKHAAEALNNRGITHQEMGNYDLAIEDLLKAIALKPEYPQAYNNLGTAYQRKKNLDMALAAYSNAITINPKFALAYLNRAAIHYLKKEYDQSQEDIDQAQRLGLKGTSELTELLKKALKRSK